jgi:hypothetical protein
MSKNVYSYILTSKSHIQCKGYVILRAIVAPAEANVALMTGAVELYDRTYESCETALHVCELVCLRVKIVKLVMKKRIDCAGVRCATCVTVE